MLASILLALSPRGADAAVEPFWDAEIEAVVLVEEGAEVTVTATQRLRLRPREPVDGLSFFLYPEHYAEDPRVDDLLAERVWPAGFSAGHQEVRDARLVDCTDPSRPGADLPVARLPSPPRARIVLPEGAGAGEFCLALRSETTVPRAFGSFGAVRGRLALNGGVLPMLLDRDEHGEELPALDPAVARLNVRTRLPAGWSGVVGGALVGWADAPGLRLDDPFTPTAEPDGALPIGTVPWLSLAAGTDAVVIRIPLDDGSTLRWWGRPLDRRQIRWIRAAATTARQVAREVGLHVPDRGPVLVEARLRRRFVEDGAGQILVSDRFLEAEEPLWRYHDVHLARAIFTAILDDATLSRETPADRRLVQDGLSWLLVERYLAARWRGHRNLRELLSRFSFLPAIDDLVETPAFPFADQVYDDPWVQDPLRADIRRWNRPLRSGRTLFLLAEDRVGPETLRAAAAAWWRGDREGPPMRDLLATRSGVPVADLFRRWEREPASHDLRVERIHRSHGPRGWRTEIVVRHLGPEPPEAPVEVVARSLSPGRRDRYDLRWDGRGELGRWVLESERRIDVVQVDPRGRLLELAPDGSSRKADNRSPRAATVTGYGYFVAVNPNLGRFVAQGVLNVRPAHDLRNHLLLRVFASERVRVGGGVTGQRYFGRPRPGRRYEHRLSVSLDLDWLDPSFAPTPAPLLLEGRVSWIWDSRAWNLSPTRGGSALVSAFVGRDLRLGAADLRPVQETAYLGFDAEAIRLLPLRPGHVLALRGRFGLVAGNVAHRLFSLGGLDGLRGVPEEWRTGPALALGAAEWRHFFVQDLDIPLPFLRFRGLQGALFAEGGVVATAGAPAPSPEDGRISVGYGLRFFGDWFGMFPGAVGVDVAWSPGVPGGHLPLPLPPDRWPTVPFQLYFVGSQSF